VQRSNLCIDIKLLHIIQFKQIVKSILSVQYIITSQNKDKPRTSQAIMTKVTVLGAAGQIGSPLSLLLKMVRSLNPNCVVTLLWLALTRRFQSPLVSELSLYDIVHAPGVAIDLNHIDTASKVSGFLPADDGLTKALTGSELVVIPAGIARKPGMTRDGEFSQYKTSILSAPDI